MDPHWSGKVALYVGATVTSFRTLDHIVGDGEVESKVYKVNAYSQKKAKDKSTVVAA